LITKKHADYLLFKLAFEIIKNQQHLTEKGFNEILSIKASMNKGLSGKLKQAFSNITPYIRPNVNNIIIQNPNWLVGFTTAEGCFLVRITDKPRTQVLLIFKLTQHIRDEQLFRNLVYYLNCGNIYVEERSVSFTVTKFSDLSEKILPLFDKYPIQGIKRLNYLDFVKV
jgi:hypothetical protein